MKKPAGAEKKRVRRSAGSVPNGSNPAGDAPPKKQAAKKDVFQSFAEKVRDHKDLMSRWAVLQETRVEYFRGKDFVSFMRNHPELKDVLESDKNLETDDIANTLLRKNLLLRCDLRALTFGAIWILFGKRVWFFPNILAEEATLEELFQFWPKKDEGEPPKWSARLFFAIVAVVAILVMRHHAPDEAARARYQKRVSNIIDDVIEWSPSLALSGMMDKQTVVNVTEHNNMTEDGEGSTEDIDGESLGELDDIEDSDDINDLEDSDPQQHHDDFINDLEDSDPQQRHGDS
nr:translocation protein sec62-like isoform X1 [Ipomoea batatas]